VDVQRLRPAQDANEVAAEQVKSLLGRLGKQGSAPLFVFDAGYDPVKLQQGLEGCPCQILVRLRAGRRFYGDPSLSDAPAHIGRPRRHGPKMKCSDPVTWPEPSAEHHCEEAGYGCVRVRAWAELYRSGLLMSQRLHRLHPPGVSGEPFEERGVFPIGQKRPGERLLH